MNDSEKPKRSWEERRQLIKHKWLVPIIFLFEWPCEWISYWLRKWAFLDILARLGHLAIIVAVISYIVGGESRQKAKHYQAWQVISAANGKTGSGGRKDALQDLHNDGVSLAGVDISKAYLPRLKLENADLSEANFSNAILYEANLSEADFRLAILCDADLHDADLSDTNLQNTNLYKAHLTFADLSGADLKYADLSDTDLWFADLSGAILTDIKGWQNINDISNAYIHSIKDPPKGFIEWATEHGAFNNANREEWEKLKQQKRQEQEKKEQRK
jgi:hypothetical protein